MLQVTVWKSKKLSDESIKPLSTFNNNNSLIPGINYFDNARIRIEFDHHGWTIWWKEEKLAFTHKEVVNIYIVYEINLRAYTVG